jgi:hypothetical protein
MKMSVETAMEIWKLGGGVAASEWQEKTPGWSRRGPIYRRRPTPVYCLEYERQKLEDLANHEHSSGHDPYWLTILTNVMRRVPKARKVIVVADAASLRSSCELAKIPMPQRNVDGSWNVGGIVATPEVWAESARKFTEAFGPRHEAEPRYAWQELAKRLASPAVMAS